MTTSINIETSKLQLSELIARMQTRSSCLLVIVACLLVLVSMSGCGLPPIASTGVNLSDLNTHQTGRILTPGVAAIRFDIPTYSASLTNNVGIIGISKNLNYAVGCSIIGEAVIIDGWQIGGGAFASIGLVKEYGFTSATGFSLSSKIALSKVINTAPFISALSLDFVTQSGNTSTGEKVLTTYYDSTLFKLTALGIDILGDNVPDSVVRWDISSKAWRIGIALPISYPVSSQSDITFRPAIYYFTYSLLAKETTTRTKTMFSNTKDISSHYEYIIPSFSFGYSFRLTSANIESISIEITLASWKSQAIATFGTAFRFPIYLVSTPLDLLCTFRSCKLLINNKNYICKMQTKLGDVLTTKYIKLKCSVIISLKTMTSRDIRQSFLDFFASA